MGLVTLKTLESFQIRSVELGILQEDQDCRSNTIIWDLRRLIKLYTNQAESVLELLPEGFDSRSIIDSLKKKEVTLARKMASEAKQKKVIK